MVSSVYEFFQQPHSHPVILGIDGKCAAGKSTFADSLSFKYNCNVIHMDDFFLPSDLRTTERLNTPGGNVHYERYMEQVFPLLVKLKETPMKDLDKFKLLGSFPRFDCHTMDYGEEQLLYLRPFTIVEGAYSMRPEFRKLYDLTLFLDIDASLQKERLLHRNGAKAYQNFLHKWIPMETQYISYYDIPSVCDVTFSLGD